MIEFAQSITLEIPLWQMVLLLVLLITCLSLGRYSLGLMGAVLFVMYWGYIYNFEKFFGCSLTFDYFALGFILLASLNLLLVVILFIHSFSLRE